MPIVAAGLLGLVLGQSPNAPMKQSEPILIKWARELSDGRAKGLGQEQVQASRDYDRKFEDIHGGLDGSLVALGGFLSGRNLDDRRAAATVLVSLRYGIGGERGAWEMRRSQELRLAAEHVLDPDPQTALNSTDTFVELLGGENWDGWDQYPSQWIRSIASANPVQQRNLASLFAFTSVPMQGAVPGLYRIYRNAEGKEKEWPLVGLCRAKLLEPKALDKVAFADIDSQNATERRAAFGALERLSPLLWSDSQVSFVADETIGRHPGLQSAWQRSSMRPSSPHPQEVFAFKIPPHNDRLLMVLEAGIKDPDLSVRLSSARALIPVGKAVDTELTWGFPTGVETYTSRVTRLLDTAATVVAKDDAALAVKASSVSKSISLPHNRD